MKKRDLYIGLSFLTVLIVLGCASAMIEDEPAAQPAAATMEGEGVPMFEVDPFWPKPLPNNWRIGSTIGLSIDSQDNVLVIHRPDSLAANELGLDNGTSMCCSAAPPVLEFDSEGNLVASWGGPSDEYEWPESNHGITVDFKDNIWIGGNGGNDAHLLKFTRDGEFLFQLGNLGGNEGSLSNENFGRVAEIMVDEETNEAFVADGYLNKRVAVLDADTGEMKRYWGAYGNEPDDTDLGPYDPDAEPAQQFRNPVHCAIPTDDGLLYVCDRVNDRIQVFQKDGTYVDEVFVAPQTLGSGSAWDIAFSRDPEQRFIYMADGHNDRVWIIERASLEILTSFGAGGRQSGQFFGVHNIAVDSAENVYTTETYEGKRLQKFVFRGMGPATEMDQGTLWPE